jgi:tetratricopeptide (TPR) repeat protein
MADFNKAIKIDPNNVAAYYGRGNTNYNLKYYSNAMADYSKVILIDPNFVNAYYGRGNTYKHLKGFLSALRDYKSAFSLFPNHPLYLINIADCYDLINNIPSMTDYWLKCKSALEADTVTQIKIDFDLSDEKIDYIRSELSRL